MALLEVKNIYKSFGGVKAIQNFSIEVNAGEIHGIIGPNGAGKTTIFNTISGVYTADEGSVFLNGQDITKMEQYKITHLGMGRTFQNIRVFSKMTVLENVAVGTHKNVHTDLFSICMNNKKQKEAEKQASEKAMEILRFLKIERFADETAGNLPYGTQRLVEIARALASEPKLLLLDEPTAGMNQQETMELMMLIQEIRKQGPAVLVIEHNMKFMMSLCHRIAVLNFGQLLTLGEPVAVQNDPQVIEAYLGNSEEE